MRYGPQLLATGISFVVLAACSRDGGAAPPEPGEGAVGTVAVDNAGAAENPKTPALSGGPEGQTPDYPNAAGAPSVIYSQPDAAAPSTGEDNPPNP